MQMNRTLINEIRVDVEKALKEVERKHGIDLSLGSGSFDSSSFTVKLVATILSGGMSLEETNFKKAVKSVGHIYKLTEEDYLKQFDYNGETFEIVGINTRAPKYPILARNILNESTYKFPRDIVEKLN